MSRIHLTGGRLGRVGLAGPPSDATRPASARLRQAVFNMLGNQLDGVSVLDCFAGVGLYGIEALARGARQATFVEQSAGICKVLSENLKRINSKDHVVIQSTVQHALADLGRQARSFDLVFLDPPYDDDVIRKLLESSSLVAILADGARTVVEHRAGTDLSLSPQWRILRQRSYGRSAVTILEVL